MHQVFGIPWDQIEIGRTKEGKPYLANGASPAARDGRPVGSTVAGGRAPPNFNYNVTHHGALVAIASDPTCLIGPRPPEPVDCVAWAVSVCAASLSP